MNKAMFAYCVYIFLFLFNYMLMLKKLKTKKNYETLIVCGIKKIISIIL